MKKLIAIIQQQLTLNILKRISITLFLFIFSLYSLVAQETYYVSITGSDNNPGTLNEPFRSISKAAKLIQAGDRCLIRGGVYRETVVLVNNGTKSNPISFANYPNEQVIITGTDSVKNWVNLGKGSWKAAYNNSVSQVFINGALGIEARYPNLQLSIYDKLSWAEVTTEVNKTGTMKGLGEFGDLKGARVVALGQGEWVCVNGTITGNTGESFSVNNTDVFWSNILPGSFLGKGRGFITGHKNLLDAPGEWFYENNNLYLISPGQLNPNDLLIEGRSRKLGFDLKNAEYVNLLGLHFKAASLSLRNATGCRVENCSFRYPTPFFHFTNGFNRNDSIPENWEGKGLEISGSNNLIKDCYIAHSWGDGLSVWGSLNTVDNCIVEDCNWLILDSAPISVAGERNTISNNTLRISGRSILVHRHLKRGLIIYNDMCHAGLTAGDLGITYDYGTKADNTVIAYNWMHDNMAEHNGKGIYLDNYLSDYLVHHNVVWNCQEGIRINLDHKNSKVYNNTFWNNENSMGSWGPAGTKMINCQVWNNIQDHETFIGNDKRNNLFATDGLFINPEKADFRLLAESKAIDFGIEISGITDNYAGKSPDAGAYELGSSWTAGSSISIPLFDDSTPPLISGFSGKAESGQIVLFWDNLSANISKFAIDRAKPGEAFKEIASVESNIFTFADTSIQLVTDYVYRLRAVNPFGSSISPDYLYISSLGDENMLKLQAEEFDVESGIVSFGSTIGACDPGDYIIFKQVDFGNGFNTFSALLGIPDESLNKFVKVYIGGPNGILAATLKPRNTGSWYTFTKQSTVMDSTITGVHDIRIEFSGGYGVGNFDWFMLENTKKEIPTGLNMNLAKKNKLIATPNPFEKNTELHFQLPQAGIVNLQVYDIQGRKIKNLVNGFDKAGEHCIQLDMSTFPKQIYIVRLTYENGTNESIMLIQK
ncbi:MAG: carbohydrate-binding protein [Prolixibacteraceae bacterium]|nr:carbohydrate-binding protein [Prolixibacteraceae bacterium]